MRYSAIDNNESLCHTSLDRLINDKLNWIVQWSLTVELFSFGYLCADWLPTQQKCSRTNWIRLFLRSVYLSDIPFGLLLKWLLNRQHRIMEPKSVRVSFINHCSIGKLLLHRNAESSLVRQNWNCWRPSHWTRAWIQLFWCDRKNYTRIMI